MKSIVESYIVIDKARKNSYLLGTWEEITRKDKHTKTYYQLIKSHK
jgi:hypothetical protein